MRVRVGAASVLMAATGTGMVSLAAPASAAAKDEALTLMVPTLATMLPGQQGWVSTMWRADQDVCDVQVTLTGKGPTVGYPASTGDFSSFYTADTLAAGNLDYTAFRVTAPAAAAPVALTLNVDYRVLPPGQIKKDDDLKDKKVVCSGPKGSVSLPVTLPVTPSTDPAVVLKTAPVLIKKDTPTWTTITFRGNRPNLDNFRVTLTPPAGLSVVYPGDRDSAGLDGGSTLPVGQDDFVRVRLDATAWNQPADTTVRVPVKATYDGGSFTGSILLGAV
ncbi:hypothetical protein ACIBSW_09295 [Actinoplanes sp. NPDC049668]|uniref:hypothetical protein n=1 Tax=unclassified Actinoplanes TaxID=2626549 RepID=UPI0033A46907